MPPDAPLAEKEFLTAGEPAEQTLIILWRMQIQSEFASWFENYYENLFTSILSTNCAIIVSKGLGYTSY